MLLKEKIEKYIGLPYTEYNCWDFIIKLLKEEKGIDLEKQPEKNLHKVQELWFFGDDNFPEIQEWDIVGIKKSPGRLNIVEHVGIALDNNTFVHSKEKTGVVIQPINYYKKHNLVLAIYRLID